MDEALKIFQDKIDSLRCGICKHYLSIPPIVVSNDLGSVCGRENCIKNLKGVETSRQSIYESLAEYLKFPCMNEEYGCKEILPWSDIQEHENVCEFVETTCPFSVEKFREEEQCTWKGQIPELLEHMEVEHAGCKIENYVKIDLKNCMKKNKIFFSKLDDDIVIVLVIFDSKFTSYWKVWSGSKIHNIMKYRIEISTETGKSIISSKMLLAELIQPDFFKCDVDHLWFQVQYDNMRTFFKSPSSLTITFYTNELIVAGPGNTHAHSVFTTMSNIYCIKCKTEILPDLYVCRKENNFYCQPCAAENSSGLCVCGSRLYLNNSFNEMSYIANQYICVICDSKVNCMSLHFREKHSDFLAINNKTYNYFIPTGFYSYNNHIFCFENNLTNEVFVFSVVCLATQNIEYKYTLLLKDSNNPSSSLSISNICSPELVNVTDESNNTSIPVDLLTRLFPDIKNINFTLTIMEI